VELLDRVYAVSDIHSPRLLPLFKQALSRAPPEPPCFLILAGDVVDKGNVEMVKPVVESIKAKWGDVSMVAVFGNEEYHSVRSSLVEKYSMITWLDDSVKLYNCGSLRVAVIGTQGSLDRLTRWQSKNMPWLLEEYRRRPQVMRELMRRARSEADVVILVSHYALASGNLRGEDPRIWPEMYSKDMEKVVAEAKPDIAVHGHAHLGRSYTVVNGVPVYNVALPAVKNITVINLKRGLMGFIK
jgi:Icc-related predicted phosphoesterase